jgi:uncharacterized membrane protein YhhN
VLAFKILFALSIALEFVFVPLYLKAIRFERSIKSLRLKMICSTLFVATGVLAALIAGNQSVFAKLILTGLAMGWFGDFFLHAKEKQSFFLVGLLSFLGGHLLYIGAYCVAIKQVAPGASFFDLVESIAFAFIFGVIVVWAVTTNLSLGPSGLPVTVYTAVLIVMFVKAGSLGIRLVMESEAQAAIICAILIFGALQFLISDSLLGIIKFAGQKNNYKMKIVNIVTYFLAQNLLASTILFIK